MRWFLISLIPLCVPSVASAASWIFVANCGEQGQVKAYSYDRDSVRREGGNVLVRIRGDYTASPGSRAQEAQIDWSFNCAGGTFVEQARTEYDEVSNVVANYTDPTGEMNITRGSIAEKVRSIVCA